MKYAWIEAPIDSDPIRLTCELLGVSPSGFYAARSRLPSARVVEQAQIVTEIRRDVVTTDSKHAHPAAPNILERDFEATAPNQKWLADLTDIPTDEGWLYLARVLDLFSRKRVGWTMSDDAARTDAGGTAGRPGLAGSRAGPGASLRSWFAIRCRRLSQSTPDARDHRLHESQRQLLGQRTDGIGQWHGQGRVRSRRALPDSRRGPAGAGRVHRLLQHGTPSLVVGQSVAGGFRATLARHLLADQCGSKIAVSRPALSTAGRFPVRSQATEPAVR